MTPDPRAIFVEVMQRGSFAAVARERGLDPSSVSRIVAGLEEELGLRLFQRSTRRLAATEAGRLYFRRVQPLLEELDLARAEAADLAGQPAGTLRLTASVAFGEAVVVPLLPALRAAEPGLRFELHLTDALLDIIEDRIDLAIRHRRPEGASLVASRLAAVRYRVAASPGWIARHGRPDRPAALSALDCPRLLLPGFRDTWAFRDRAGAMEAVPVGGSLLLSSALGSLEAARAGLGPTLLADWLARADLARGDLVDLFPDHEVSAADFDAAIWLVHPSRSYVPAKVRVFAEFLRRAMARRQERVG